MIRITTVRLCTDADPSEYVGEEIELNPKDLDPGVCPFMAGFVKDDEVVKMTVEYTTGGIEIVEKINE